MPVLQKMVGFVITTDPERAKAFYGGVLGFKVVSDDPFAIAFDANGTMLRVTKAKEFTPAPHTILGWQVDDIRQAVAELVAAGVTFERYPGMPQDKDGICTFPGAYVAWFKDPEGNVLSISQHLAASS